MQNSWLRKKLPNFQALGPLSPRDPEIVAKPRTAVRLATDSVTTFLSETERNVLRSEEATSIGLVTGTWEKQDRLRAEMTHCAR